MRYPHGYTVLPLHGIERGEDGRPRCACKRDCGAKPGKHPALMYSRLSPGEQVYGNAGHAVATGIKSSVFVIETDTVHAALWLQEKGIPKTRTVKSAKGYHYHFAWPGFPVKSSQGEIYPGVDIRGEGGIAVLEGSPHESGATYELVLDVPPAPAPQWLLDWPGLRKTEEDAPEGEGWQPLYVQTDTEEGARRLSLAEQACQTFAPAVQGKGGNAAMLALIGELKWECELAEDVSIPLVLEYWNPRCEPPWEEKDLRRAFRNSQRQAGWCSKYAPDINLVEKTPPFAPPKKGDIVVEYGLGEDAPIEYLVDTILPVASVGMFVAQPGAMKTWAAYSLAIAVSQGKPWLGRYASRKGAVIILDYEMGRGRLKRRLRMLGDDGTIGRIVKPVQRLNELAIWAKLRELRPSLVIVDALSSGQRMADENDQKAAVPLDLAGDLANELGTSFVFIHHSIKDTNGKNKESWIRGSSAILGSIDTCFVFQKLDSTESEKRASVQCIRVREGEEPRDFAIKLTDAKGLELYEEAHTPAAKALKSGSLPDAIRMSLAESPIGEGPQTGRELAARLERRVADVQDCLRDMKARGEAIEYSRKWHLDGPNIRLDRIREVLQAAEGGAVTPVAIASEKKLAKVAHVGVEDLRALIATGKLRPTSEGSGLCGWYLEKTEQT